MIAPGGVLLARRNTNDPKAIVPLLKSALEKWKRLDPSDKRLMDNTLVDSGFRWEQLRPKGGLHLRRTARDLPANGDPSAQPGERFNREAVWFSAEEAHSIIPENQEQGAKKRLPDVITKRLSCLVFVDNIRGQTIPYHPSEDAGSELWSEVTRIDGSQIHLALHGFTAAKAAGPWRFTEPNDWTPRESQRHPHSIKTQVLGTAVFDRASKRFDQFNLLALGQRNGRTINNARGGQGSGHWAGGLCLRIGTQGLGHPPHIHRCLRGRLGRPPLIAMQRNSILIILALAGLALLTWISLMNSPEVDGAGPVLKQEPKSSAQASTPLVGGEPSETRTLDSASPPTEQTGNPNPNPTEPIRFNGAVLRGNIKAKNSQTGRPFEVKVTITGDGEKQFEFNQNGAGKFEADLGQYLGNAEPQNIKVLVTVTSEGYRPSSAWAKLQQATDHTEQPAVYTATLKPTLIERVIRGRILAQEGKRLTKPLVCFLRDDRNKSNSFQSLDHTKPDEQGEFELRLTRLSPGWLIASAEGHAVHHIRFDSFGPSPIELGDLQLPPGATITGRAVRNGRPVAQGSTVFARLPGKRAPNTLLERNLQPMGDRVAYREVSTKTDALGEFELTGLETGWTYHLIAQDKASGIPYQGQLAAGTQVRAPARNIQLDWGMHPVHLRIHSGGKPVGGTQIRAIVPDEGEWKGTFIIHRGGWQSPIRGNSKGEASLMVGTGVITHLEISAPNHETLMHPIDPSKLPESGEVTIEMEQGAQSGNLAIQFEGVPPKELEGTMVFAYLFDLENGLTQQDPAWIRNGVALIKNLPAGTDELTFTLILATQRQYNALPYIESKSRRIKFEALEAGSTAKHIEKLAIGGRIELTLTGLKPNANTDPKEPALFELIDSSGKVHKARVLFPDEKGQAKWGSWVNDGTGLIEYWIQPGEYTLRQVGPSYQEDEITVTVRAGQQEPVHMTLRPR